MNESLDDIMNKIYKGSKKININSINYCNLKRRAERIIEEKEIRNENPYTIITLLKFNIGFNYSNLIWYIVEGDYLVRVDNLSEVIP